MSAERVNILTLKWGPLYSAEYVNRVYRGVKRNLHRPFRFVCVTDDPAGLDPAIDAHPSHRTVGGFQDFEKPLNCHWWRAQKFRIGLPDGIFTHNRIDR